MISDVAMNMLVMSPDDRWVWIHTNARTHACTLFGRSQDINVCLRGECELLLKVQNHFTLLP